MSLKEVSLDPFLIAGLYRQPLIPRANVSEDASPEKDVPIPSLGNNKQRWLLLINNKEEAFLDEKTFNMLLKLLNACKLTLDDIALVNMAHLKSMDLAVPDKQFSPVKTILFGDVFNERAEGHPKNEMWEENGIHFLYTDSLKEMDKDQQLKLPFWNALKGFLST